MDPFVEQLKGLCTAHPTRSKWVFVPTHMVGRTLGERLAVEGTNWLNLRFVTPLDIALRMGAPFLVERGIDPSEEDLGPALMMRLLLDLPEGGYFRPLAHHPTMAQALWTTVRELRMAGVRPDAFKPGTITPAAKHAELVSVLEAYERFLVRNRRGDMAAVYEEALKHPDWCPIQPQDCWTELPDWRWSPLQRTLVDSMPGERLRPRALAVPGVLVPRLLVRPTERVAADAATNPLAFLMAPGAGQQESAIATIALFHAGGREAEVEEVFRRIVATGVSLDQVEIACASDAHVALIWEKALRHNWPVTLGPGIPAALTRPGRALIGLCDWIETDFSAGHFRRLLQSGDLHVGKDRGFTTGEAARLLARAEAGWGRATYRLALGRLHKSYEARAEDPDASEGDRAYARTRAEQVARVRDWLAELVSSIPEPEQDGQVPLPDVVHAALAFLEGSTSRSSALDQRAAAALQDYVRELNQLGAFRCDLSLALRFIRERVQSLHVASERPRPGHLYACSLSQCGYAGRAHLFVVGPEEGRVFSSPTEDAVLLDAERAAISADLRLSSDRLDEAVYAVLARLAASAASVTFSYSCRDTREFRETYASWLMLQALRLQRRDATLSYHDLKASLGEPKSAVPADRGLALSSGPWWLTSVLGSGGEGAASVTATFDDLARGLAAEQARQATDFTEFDGYVPEAGPLLDPSAPGTVLSVTELENAAGCPFRFFLKRGLGIRAIEDRERDRDVWLDPLTRGSELHALYAALSRRARDANRRPDKEDGAWLMALAQDRLRQLNEEMPAATPEILERESKEFLADVELFFNAEAADTSSTPVGFEVSFGRPLEDDELEPLAREEPVEVDLGGGVNLRIAGRIDRVDIVGKSEIQVLDYKTGGYWPDEWKGTFRGGRRLQHALYGLAAAELLKRKVKNPRVTGGVYYFSSRKGGQERVEIPAPTRAATAAVLADLRALIVNGQFVRTANERDCRFCDYLEACGGDVNKQAEAKLPHPRLADYQRLTEHE
jgi:RecB family exonuclease